MTEENQDIQGLLKERYEALPPIVQKAITSADTEKRLRELSTLHKLHIDQWEQLENEVMMAMLGMLPIENLAANVEKEVGVSHDVAVALAADISRVVFEPIRAELAREIEENSRGDVTPLIPHDESAVPVAVPVQPAVVARVAPVTPPQPAPSARVDRSAAVLPEYQAGQASTVRASVASDPYREAAA